jgi:glycogen debranching enzyme
MSTQPPIPHLEDKIVQRALRIALGDLAGNIQYFKDGLLKREEPCLLAGLDYDKPWTRDAALNTWYGLGLVAPEVAKNTLLSVLQRNSNGDLQIGGEYWDAIIWAQGAWQYYLYTGDQSILEISWSAITNSLRHFEETEQDERDGLFRGGACFQDGIAAYPDYLAPKKTAYTGITGYLGEPDARPAAKGVGVPCKALSTNCLYVRAYQIVELLEKELGKPLNAVWSQKATALRQAINHHFWREELGTYGYLLDAPDRDDKQEGFGLAFALLFGIADDAKAKRIFDNVYISPHGIPCVWPTYDRYRVGSDYGRHSGTIWPQVNAAWALACHARGRTDLALQELWLLAEKACRDSEFVEVYHPETGLPYGGLQESLNGTIDPYWVCHRQSWCASGYIIVLLFCLLKLEVPEDQPLPENVRTRILAKIPRILFEPASL